MEIVLKSQWNVSNDRSFLLYCDIHLSETDYRKRKSVGRAFGSNIGYWLDFEMWVKHLKVEATNAMNASLQVSHPRTVCVHTFHMCFTLKPAGRFTLNDSFSILFNLSPKEEDEGRRDCSLRTRVQCRLEPLTRVERWPREGLRSRV